MFIQKISAINYFNKFTKIKNSNENKNKNTDTTEIKNFTNMPANINFEARVDKGLVRFYEFNKDKMPSTVKKYITNLGENLSKTPLEAQATAFGLLASATSITAIQAAYPDEELFKDLKEPTETKATRGILGTFRENQELLSIFDQGFMANNENLTVWLVKKIFLEGKTLDEINHDFKKEAHPDFIELYNQKEGEIKDNKNIIRSSTLKALGIKTPDPEYQQSLRYTRDGYSDLVGEKISQAQRDFWESMPIEERTARNRKSVQRFENWWNSLSYGQKLDMIAFQTSELEMLDKFNNSDIGKTRKNRVSDNPIKQEKPITTTKKALEKIETGLSRDDLFKIWAGNNLKLFEANLTEYDRSRIETKREQRRAEWWKNMSPTERTAYIEKLRQSSEQLRFAMIDAWNHTPEILVDLSFHLKKKHIEKPTDILYGTNSFSEFMSQAMTEFWEKNPEHAEKLGNVIKASHERIKDAMSNGSFERLKQEIMKNRIKREKQTSEEIKNYRELLPEELLNSYPDYVQDFIINYKKSDSVDIKTLPLEYIKDFLDNLTKDLTKDQIISMVKSLKKEDLTAEDIENINQVYSIESVEAFATNMVLETTLADILYKCTSDPQVYSFSSTDCKIAMKQITSGKDNITIHSNKLNEDFSIPILNKNINFNEIDQLYKKYKTPLTSNECYSIVKNFFILSDEIIKDNEKLSNTVKFLISYITQYQGSNSILFSYKSEHTPECRAYFAKKFLSNLPQDISPNDIGLRVQKVEDFEKEDLITNVCEKLKHKFDFLPTKAQRIYNYELQKKLRNASMYDIKDFYNNHTERKKSINETQQSLLLNRQLFERDHKLYTLCIEQALSDILYDISGEEKVYNICLEELLNIVETILLVKKPSVTGELEFNREDNNETFIIKLKKLINPYKINNIFNEYVEEINKYLDECENEKKELDEEDILYILNPDENRPNRDKYTMERIKSAFINKQK